MNPISNEEIIKSHIDQLLLLISDPPDYNDNQDYIDYIETVYVRMLNLKELIKIVYK